jgi:hypothetical protein
MKERKLYSVSIKCYILNIQDIIESHLNGKSICLSLNYEIDNFHEMLSIVQPTF